MNQGGTAATGSLAVRRLTLRVGSNAELERDRKAIENRLAVAIDSNGARIDDAARRSLLNGGKRVRPLLTCAVLRALGEDPADHIDVVVAVEMAHAGSLLHDDIIDESQTRRGRLTGHVEFDVPTAVLAGDRLVVLAVEQLARGGSSELLVRFSTAIKDLCVGESLERECHFDASVGLQQVRQINRLKTASLFAYAAEAGAMLAGSPPRLRRAAHSYGMALGEAFQITDDHLDFCGDPQVMGKSIGQDLSAGVVTVPGRVTALPAPGPHDRGRCPLGDPAARIRGRRARRGRHPVAAAGPMARPPCQTCAHHREAGEVAD
jgi:octaprenyl-diphosphate synthase